MRRTLVIGYGNLMRSDDGVGICIVKELGQRMRACFETFLAQQLHVELAEEISKYDLVVFVDASEGGPEVQLEKLEGLPAIGMSSSHHVNPGLILKLAQELYGAWPEVWICSVRGENFGLGQEISLPTQSRMKVAVERIESILSMELRHA